MDFFQGVYEKILRAKEVIGNLQIEIDNYLKLKRKSIEICTFTENNSKEHVTLIKGDSYPPLRFSVLSGEIVFHLRSSLDHLIYALIQASEYTPLENSQFPICSIKNNFENAQQSGNLKGVPPKIIEYIESKQPYNTKDPVNSTLKLIQELNNIDKHRLLAVVCCAARMGREIIFTEDANCCKKSNEPAELEYISPPTKSIIIPKGTEICRLKFANPVPDIKCKVEVSVEVVFDKCGSNDFVPIIRTLNKMQSYTSKLIEEIFSINK